MIVFTYTVEFQIDETTGEGLAYVSSAAGQIDHVEVDIQPDECSGSCDLGSVITAAASREMYSEVK